MFAENLNIVHQVEIKEQENFYKNKMANKTQAKLNFLDLTEEQVKRRKP